VFKPLHPPGVLEENLRPDQCLGPVDPTTVKSKAPRPLTEDERRIRNAREQMPPLDAMINLYDFEIEAEKVLSKTAWAYYRSAGEHDVIIFLAVITFLTKRRSAPQQTERTVSV
jgi:L-lactate dehydrogenase (cytochrome)